MRKNNSYIDLRYGFNSRENKAIEIARMLNGCSWVISFWLLIWPHPYNLVVLLAFIWPLLGIGLVKAYPGIIDFYDLESVPSIFTTTFPGMVLALRAFLDYNLLFSYSFWAYTMILSGIIFLVYVTSSSEAKRKLFYDNSDVYIDYRTEFWVSGSNKLCPRSGRSTCIRDKSN